MTQTVFLSPRCAADKFPCRTPVPPNHRLIVVPDSDYRIKLQVFEGPLDLLLFLIRKNELDIYDIPIESVTRQYVDALHAMQQLDLDLAGEFFVMAATLMEIKSRLLLPKGQHAVDPNAEDEEVDPRWELVHQLLQYKKFKEAAAALAGLVETRQNLMVRHVSSLSSDDGDRPLKNVDRIELWNMFNIVLRRLAEKLVVGEIHDEMITVADQMEWLLEQPFHLARCHVSGDVGAHAVEEVAHSSERSVCRYCRGSRGRESHCGKPA